jgi:hypothetical protein
MAKSGFDKNGGADNRRNRDNHRGCSPANLVSSFHFCQSAILASCRMGLRDNEGSQTGSQPAILPFARNNPA